MKQISIHQFTFTKETQTLSAFESDLRGVIDFAALLNFEAFEIVGKRETRRYCFVEVEREQTRFEAGDITAWKFRPVDGYGRGIDGPRLIVFND